jgi:hypothetical protein
MPTHFKPFQTLYIVVRPYLTMGISYNGGMLANPDAQISAPMATVGEWWRYYTHDGGDCGSNPSMSTLLQPFKY